MISLRKKIKKSVINSQAGAALLIAVLVLLLLTVIGIYAVTTSTMETKISGFHRWSVAAFYSADAGIDRTVATYDFTSLADADHLIYNTGDISYDVSVDYLIDTVDVGHGNSPLTTRAYRYKIDSTGSSFGTTSEVQLWCTKIGYKVGGGGGDGNVISN
jgi:hypothetical protein